MSYRRLWQLLGLVMLIGFAILGFFGVKIYQQVPPIPTSVVSTDGQVVFTKDDIQNGQAVWQSAGGQELGTVWGHGAYLAPDWSADWLHKEAVYILDALAQQQFQQNYADVDEAKQAGLKIELKHLLRTNTHDPETGTVTVAPIVAEAIAHLTQYYDSLFGDDPQSADLRKSYSMLTNTVTNAEHRRQLSAFFFWAAWACVTDRPGETGMSYTSNWPAERLVGNGPLPSLTIVSIISVILMLAGIGALVWYHAFSREEVHADAKLPKLAPPTNSMKATGKFFVVALLVLLAQVAFGVLTAHYTTEGNSFFGLPMIGEWFPYTVTRTWHVQAGLFWIATALLATGLYIGPMISGYEPKWQRLGVNFLWVCLLVIVAGSMFGEWLGIHHYLSLKVNFYFGHQGYQYVDLGRFWQIFLFVGLFVWLGLMFAALKPAFKKTAENIHLLTLFFLSCACIGAFYGAGLMWGQHTNLAITEYWRWWVVHLWVEGFFEVFTTVAVAFLFTRLGLISIKSATTTCLLATSIFMLGGVVGLFHHLYFTGTSQMVIVLGGLFSALEVVPLALMGFDAYHNWSLSKVQPWVKADYRWPIYFFIAVCFWNLVGAGLLGFMINTPIALYYMQGLNTTALHAHASLFGVYGNLSIGLLLFCLKGLTYRREWNQKTLAVAFWLLNIGIGAQCFLSLMPIGLTQFWTSLIHDMWFARSVAFTGSDLVHNLIWVRVLGDTCFGLGVLSLIASVVGIFFKKPELLPTKQPGIEGEGL